MEGDRERRMEKVGESKMPHVTSVRCARSVRDASEEVHRARLLAPLPRSVSQNPTRRFLIRAWFVEVYREKCRDLLSAQLHHDVTVRLITNKVRPFLSNAHHPRCHPSELTHRRTLGWISTLRRCFGLRPLVYTPHTPVLHLAASMRSSNFLPRPLTPLPQNHRVEKVELAGATEETIRSETQLRDVLERGLALRQTAENHMHTESSRSHALFRIVWPASEREGRARTGRCRPSKLVHKGARHSSCILQSSFGQALLLPIISRRLATCGDIAILIRPHLRHHATCPPTQLPRCRPVQTVESEDVDGSYPLVGTLVCTLAGFARRTAVGWPDTQALPHNPRGATGRRPADSPHFRCPLSPLLVLHPAESR